MDQDDECIGETASIRHRLQLLYEHNMYVVCNIFTYSLQIKYYTTRPTWGIMYSKLANVDNVCSTMFKISHLVPCLCTTSHHPQPKSVPECCVDDPAKNKQVLLIVIVEKKIICMQCRVEKKAFSERIFLNFVATMI